MSTLPLPRRRPEVIDFLATRRSVSAKTMGAPGPDRAEVEAILGSASRVPDHRKLGPWRFLVVTDGELWGGVVRDRYAELHPDADDKQLAIEAARFARAPVAVGLVYSPKDCVKGTPEWEQQLAVGACGYGLLLAAKARGWGANWLTEWICYDAAMDRAFGLEAGERMAGWFHIGTPTVASLSERPRPDVAERTTWL